MVRIRYEAGDVDAQEWGAPNFFFAPPASLSSSSSSSFSPLPPASQSLERLGSTTPGAPIAVSSATEPAAAAAAVAAASSTVRGISNQGQETGSKHFSESAAAAAGSDGGGGGSGVKTIFSGTKASTSNAGKEDEIEGEKATAAIVSESWGPEAVKVAIFGDMGTAEVDGTLDAGHTNEPPSIRTVGILKDQLGAGAQPVSGGSGGEAGQADITAPEPQLGLVLHIGDLSYARGYDAQWDEVSRTLSHVFFVCLFFFFMS